MGLDLNLGEFLTLVMERWHQRTTIALMLAVVVLGGLSLFSDIDLAAISLGEWVLLGTVVIGLLFLWRTTTAVHKAPPDAVGFVVAISARSPDQQRRIADDFVHALRDLLSKGSVTHRFALIELPQYHANKINSSEDARAYLTTTNSHFILYGRARERRIQGEDHHVLDMQGIVVHKAVPPETHQKLSIEFAELFPSRVLMSVEDDLFKFEFTSKLVDLVARYIIGIASLLSGDLDYAQSLFNSLEEKLPSASAGNQTVDKIRERLPKRLTEVHLTRAGRLYEAWRQSGKPDLLTEMKKDLDALQDLAPELYPAHLLRSIWYFLTDRDVAQAIKEVLKCRRTIDDVTWRYNYAFLLCYEGRFEKAVRNYKKAANGYCDAPKLLEMEDFICWVSKQEPDSTHLHFCLGLLNFFGKGDDERALKDFQAFVELTPEGQFPDQVQLAKAYMGTIRGRTGDDASR